VTDIRQALESDGDGYLYRNRAGIGTIADPVTDAVLEIHATTPIGRVLEIGCSTGFRLEKLRMRLGADCHGLEASPDAVHEGRAAYPLLHLEQGLAPEDLDTWRGSRFDCIILGFFTYLLPRESLFSLAATVDQLLADGGHLIVFDFLSPSPTSSPYAHHPALTTYKADPSAPWLWSPTYCLVNRSVYSLTDEPSQNADPGNWKTLDVLRKNPVTAAYPSSARMPSVHDGPASA
jgi:SAM-dependent methyltransferase